MFFVTVHLYDCVQHIRNFFKAQFQTQQIFVWSENAYNHDTRKMLCCWVMCNNDTNKFIGFIDQTSAYYLDGYLF